MIAEHKTPIIIQARMAVEWNKKTHRPSGDIPETVGVPLNRVANEADDHPGHAHAGGERFHPHPSHC